MQCRVRVRRAERSRFCKESMIRSYVVPFAFVTFRIVGGVLQVTHVGTFQEQLALSAWVCWAAPLLVTELVIRRGRPSGRPSAYVVGADLQVGPAT